MKALATMAMLAALAVQSSPTMADSMHFAHRVKPLGEGSDVSVLFHANAQTALREAPRIAFVTEASAVIELEQATVFVDPVGAQAQYARFGRPDIVVLTRANPSHLSIDTMIGMLRRDTVVLAPQQVIDQLPLMISNNTFAPFDPGGVQEVDGIRFAAFPATAGTPRDAQEVPRARGDIGVLMEVDGLKFYF